jgi:hypothetical protein
MIQILLQGFKVCFASCREHTADLTYTDGPSGVPTLLCSRAFHIKLNSSCPDTMRPQVCAVINACFLPFTEGLAPFRELARIGPVVLLTNAAVAFGLNVAAVFLIGAAGGLVLTLAGVLKVNSAFVICSTADASLGYTAYIGELSVLREQDYSYTDFR